MDGVIEDLRKLGVSFLRVGGWLPRTGNLGGNFFGRPRLTLGCSTDDDDAHNAAVQTEFVFY
jgi:hypothetical protein